VPSSLDQVRHEVARANRILANEGVVDGFGHVSVRHPDDPNRYLLSRSRSPELIQASDIFEFTLDSEPVRPPTVALYAERVIHGCIYQARPDVNAVVHHHAAAIMPFVIAGVDIIPVFHLGAAMGQKAPFWNQADEFGDTNMLVVKPEEGRSLAKALGEHSMVLMRNHGATVVGSDLRQLLFRAIFSRDNALYQMQAALLGKVTRIRPGEAEMAGALGQMPTALNRASEYWSVRLDKAEGAKAAKPAAPAKRAAAGSSRKQPAAKKAAAKKAKGRKSR
jgi:ribulose-5-phosphate 4-epimerase/fuculose-1-phosphate aldolase